MNYRLDTGPSISAHGLDGDLDGHQIALPDADERGRRRVKIERAVGGLQRERALVLIDLRDLTGHRVPALPVAAHRPDGLDRFDASEGLVTTTPRFARAFTRGATAMPPTPGLELG